MTFANSASAIKKTVLVLLPSSWLEHGGHGTGFLALKFGTINNKDSAPPICFMADIALMYKHRQISQAVLGNHCKVDRDQRQNGQRGGIEVRYLF